MQSEPCYFAVIPAYIRYHKKLSAGAKLLFGEIDALSNIEGFCWASNNFFSDLYGVSGKTIRRWLAELRNNKIVRIELNIKSDVKRKIYIIYNNHIYQNFKNKKGERKC